MSCQLHKRGRGADCWSLNGEATIITYVQSWAEQSWSNVSRVYIRGAFCKAWERKKQLRLRDGERFTFACQIICILCSLNQHKLSHSHLSLSLEGSSLSLSLVILIARHFCHGLGLAHWLIHWLAGSYRIASHRFDWLCQLVFIYLSYFSHYFHPTKLIRSPLSSSPLFLLLLFCSS